MLGLFCTCLISFRLLQAQPSLAQQREQQRAQNARLAGLNKTTDAGRSAEKEKRAREASRLRVFRQGYAKRTGAAERCANRIVLAPDRSLLADRRGGGSRMHQTAAARSRGCSSSTVFWRKGARILSLGGTRSQRASNYCS